MTDRDKVLQALEHCDLCSDMSNCPGCAYLREPDCMEHLKRDIIALLKAQEPIVPIRCSAHAHGADDVWYECGGCGEFLGVNRYSKQFCAKCGRPVKWA